MEMRAPVLIALVPAAALIAAPRPAAAAYNLPWCAQFYTLGQVKSCAYATYEDCLATIRGVGGVCVRNAYYPPGPLYVDPRRRRPHHAAAR
jgi:hypothetical protein